MGNQFDVIVVGAGPGGATVAALLANENKKVLYIYIGTKSVIPGISPEGKQVIYAVISCTADPKQDVEPYLEYIEERTATVFPGLYEEGVIERKEIMSLPMVMGLGNDSVLPI